LPTKERLEKERARQTALPENVAAFIDIVNNERHTFGHSFGSLEGHRFGHPLIRRTYTVSLSPIQFDATAHDLHKEVREAAIRIAEVFLANAARGLDLPKRQPSLFDEPFPGARLLSQTKAASIDREDGTRRYAQCVIDEGAATALDVIHDAALTLVMDGTYRALHRCHCGQLFFQPSDNQQHCSELCRRAAYRRRRGQQPRQRRATPHRA